MREEVICDDGYLVWFSSCRVFLRVWNFKCWGRVRKISLRGRDEWKVREGEEGFKC